MAKFEDGLIWHPFGSRLLRRATPAMAGTDVKVLQTIYNEALSIMTPALGPLGEPVKPDGVFGSVTEQAVRNVQTYFGLMADGIAGSQTYAAFGQAVGARSTYGGPVFGSRSLSAGVHGGDVVVLQNRLNGFRYAASLAAPATGSVDPETTAGIVAFQQDATIHGDTGIPTTGTVQAETFDALWIYTYVGGRNLSVGVNGFDTAWLQLFLSKQISSRHQPFYRGRVDGYFGPQTELAVRLWQSDAGIRVDGVVGPRVFHSLGMVNDQVAPFPAPPPQF